MNETKVSVIIPTYHRRELLLSRAIPSILDQTHQDFEIIVVGDKCVDDTPQYMEKLAKYDSRVRFYDLPVRGNGVYPDDADARWLCLSAPPLNKGIEMATGDWIMYLDDDDEYFLDRMEILLTFAEEGKYDFVYSSVLYHHSGGWHKLYSVPPRVANITRQSMMYSASLQHILVDEYCWKIPQPSDFNHITRLMAACKSWGSLDRITARHFPDMTAYGV